MISGQRDLFSIPDDITYLNCAYTSPLLKASEATAQSAVSAKASPWAITQTDFFTKMESIRSLFAKIIESSSENIAIIPAVSYGIAIAAKNLPFSKGQNIVVLEDQFPSNIYSWQRLVDKKQGTIKTAPRRADFDWTQSVLETMDENTAIVAVPNCHWTDGTLLDLVKIGKACREQNAALVIDATQSLGALPFAIDDVKPDFLITTGHKWLMGPYSIGYCYIADKWLDTDPLEENWLNRLDSQDFSRLVDYQDKYQPGARRFDVGGASNFFLCPVAEASLQQLLKWGIKNIAETLETKTDLIARKAESLNLTVPPKPMRSPHLTGIIFSNGIPKDLPAKLTAEKIFVSVRGNSIRIAPHLYNNENDFNRLFGVLSNFR
jgi:selenocysteine lyase/cysteine desulfurase